MKKQYLIFCLTLIGLAIGIYQYIQIFQAEIVQAIPSPGHSWSQMECTTGLCVTADNNIGIGTVSPTKKLEVVGDIKAQGDICNDEGNCLGSLAGLVNTCGTAAKTYAYSASAFDGTYCFLGNPTPNPPSFPNAGSSTTWTCPVTSGSPISCLASHTQAPVNGACGTANNTNSYSAPSTAAALCSQGTATAVTTAGYSWTWACTGLYGGSTASCITNRKVDGVCGSTGPYPSLSIGPCSAGTSSNLSGSGDWTWNCYGINGGGMVSCTGRYGHTSCDMANYVGSSYYSGGTLFCGACGSSSNPPGGWRWGGYGVSQPDKCGYSQWMYFY